MNNSQASALYVGSNAVQEVRKGSQLVLAPNGDALWYKANERPSLDLRFAEDKSLVDATTGSNLVDFTRASSGTYVGSDGLIKTATTNLLTYGEEFDNGAWNKSQIQNFGSGSIANAIASPDGSITADFVAENTATAIHRVQRSSLSITLGTSYTVSVYAKSTNRNLYLNMAGDFGAKANFNLLTGQIVSSSGVASVLDVGGGWYRCSLAGTALSTKTTAGFFFQINTNTNDADENYTGDGTSGIYIWGAQLEQSTTASEYVKTTSTINSAPRFDHNPTTGESLGLLVEESRTNLLSGNSQNPGGAGWGGGGTTTLDSAITAPDGTTGGVYYVSTSERVCNFAGNGLSAVCVSFFVKQRSGQSAVYRIEVFQSTDTVISLGSQDFYFTGAIDGGSANPRFSNFSRTAYSNGWFRFSAVITTASGTFNNTARLDLEGSAYSNYIWGAQLEAGAFPTSYIPTTTATVTRSADVVSISGSNFSGWYNEAVGSFYSESSILGLNTIGSTRYANGVFKVRDNTVNNSFSRTHHYSQDANMKLMAGARDPSGIQFLSVLGNRTANTLYKAASAFTNGTADAALCINGSTAGINLGTTCTLSGSTTLLIGAGYFGAIGGGAPSGDSMYLNGTLKRLSFWPQRLPNETLQTITQ